MARNRTGKHDTAGAEAKRWPRSIRFFEGEWERIEAFAATRGLTGPEFVRFAALSAIAERGASVARLAPLIKRTFRGTYLLASKMRSEMLAAGETEELDEMIATARAFQDKLLREK